MRFIITTEQDRKEYIRRISEVTLDGKKRFLADFRVYRVKRSLPQNRLYWMWLRCIKDETGNEEEHLHQYFKDRFLSFELVAMFGEQTKIAASTSDLDTKAFSEYLEKIRMHMQDQGILLPKPGEAAWEQFYAQYGVKG